MIIKLLFIIGLIFLYFLLRARGEERAYFYTTIIMLSVRELDVPYLGDLTPATAMILTMLIGNLSKVNLFRRSNVPFLLTLGIGIFLGFLNVGFDLSRMINWSLLLFNVLALASLTCLFITDGDELKTFVRCIVATCLIFSITTIIGYFGYGDGTVIYNGKELYLEDTDILHSSRWYGIAYSNLVQIISVMTICILPSLGIKDKWIEYALIAIFCYSALITIKRTAFVAMIISLAYYLYCQVKENNYKAVTIVSVVSVAMIGMYWDAMAYRFEIAGILGTEDVTDHSTLSRFSRIGLAIDAFKESPLFGMGSGYVIYVHNGFFEILGNCGILGVLSIFLKFMPKIRDVVSLNPWAIVTLLYVVTCFSLEASINHAQIIYFLGLYLGGYYVSTNPEYLNHATESELHEDEE